MCPKEMCHGCGCGRSCSDVLIVTCLVLVTLYSTHSFYLYLFPNTLTALRLAVMSVLNFNRLSALDKRRGTAANLSTSTTDGEKGVHEQAAVAVSALSCALFMVSFFLVSMFAWAYVMAVYVAPGFIPFTFRQREKLSAVLSLNVFYEPLPYEKCSTCEQIRRESADVGGGSFGMNSSTTSASGRSRRNRSVYPPLPQDATPPSRSDIRLFSPKQQSPEATPVASAARPEVSQGDASVTTNSITDMEGVDGQATLVEVEPTPSSEGTSPSKIGRTRSSMPKRPQTSFWSSAASPSSGVAADEITYEHFFFNRRANAYTSVKNNYLNFCPLCFSYKPQRAHHCSKCNRCILKYDHHCPWLGQCVGFFNYKNYLLVLLYSFLLTSWVLLLLCGAFFVCVLERRAAKNHAAALAAEGKAGGKSLTATGLSPTSAAGGRRQHSSGSSFLDRLLDELRVGPPTFGVLVCLLEALLFFLMSAYLLRRHFFFARHNITTIDLVIHEHERLLNQESSSDDERTPRRDGDDEAATPGGTSDNFMFDNNKKNYRARTLARFLKKNVFDLGVRRNLLQVFGDAELHRQADVPDTSDLPADIAEKTELHYFQDLMESDQFAHKRFAVRWFWRLLPLRAYPAQVQWDSLTDMKQRQLLSGHGVGGGAGYGATASRGQWGTPEGPRSSSYANNSSILVEYGVSEQQLLGLRFPTKASLGL